MHDNNKAASKDNVYHRLRKTLERGFPVLLSFIVELKSHCEPKRYNKGKKNVHQCPTTFPCNPIWIIKFWPDTDLQSAFQRGCDFVAQSNTNL